MITWTERAKVAISKMGQTGIAKTDKTTTLRLSSVSSVPSLAVFALPERISSVLAVPSPTVLEKHDSSNAVIEDPDRWCWPHSSAMNGAEIDTFTARLRSFTAKGLPRSDADALADKLVIRDRESDDRQTCLECSLLDGYGQSSWRCSNWKCAGIAIFSRDSKMPLDFAVQHQRCDGFTH